MFISVLVASIVCAVLWDHTDRRLLLGWFAAVFAVAAVRVALMLGHARDRQRERRVPIWERRFIVTLTLTGLVWGIGGWWILPPHSLIHQAVVYFFLMGIAAGAGASYSVHARATTLAVISVMLPVTLWFAWQDEPVLRAMALGGLVYMAAAYRATNTLAYFVRHSFELAAELRLARDQARQLARIDELTGLLNRRAFNEFAERVLRQAQRSQRPIAALMLDIDHFKRVNDGHGHAAGDETLKMIAGVIEDTVRGGDIAGRLGGEEFGIILPDTAIAAAAATAERLRQRASETVVRHGDVEVRVTCSVGAAQRAEGESIDDLLARADAALYAAKHAGRDRVRVAD